MEQYEIVFESDNIIYTKLNENLINDYLLMINDIEIAKFITHNIKTYTYEEEKEWVRTKLKENATCYSMLEKKTGKYIGNIELMNIKNGISELGICITKTMQNKHYGTEALKAIINYGFSKLKLKVFELNVYKTNQRAIHCYEKIGFVKTGIGKCEEDWNMIYKPE